MRVEKWYLDCVADDGAGVIGYAARLRWGVLALRCSETLVWGAPDAPAADRLVLGGALPGATAESIQWGNTKLAVAGRWRPVAAGLPAVVLHAEAAGRIEWRCVCPAAEATMALAGERRAGRGYVEQLVVTLPPGRLPLRELHWGRFIAAGQTCVWIRWAGAVARRWCWHNGQAVAAELADGPTLAWAGHRLEWGPGRTLRSGRIADTVLGSRPWLRRWLPAGWREVRESKWCSRAALTDAAGRRHEGWAIHEVVHFP